MLRGRKRGRDLGASGSVGHFVGHHQTRLCTPTSCHRRHVLRAPTQPRPGTLTSHLRPGAGPQALTSPPGCLSQVPGHPVVQPDHTHEALCRTRQARRMTSLLLCLAITIPSRTRPPLPCQAWRPRTSFRRRHLQGPVQWLNSSMAKWPDMKLRLLTSPPFLADQKLGPAPHLTCIPTHRPHPSSTRMGPGPAAPLGALLLHLCWPRPTILLTGCALGLPRLCDASSRS